MTRIDEESQDPLAGARKRAAWVGTGLLVVAILGALSNFGVLAISSTLRRLKPPPAPPPGMSREDARAWQAGQDAAPAIDACCLGFVSLIYLPVFLGGLKLQQGDGGVLPWTSAILAMLPCSPGFLVGLPVGIWALVVLNDEEVGVALRRPARPARRMQGSDDYPREG